ncbi:type II toxin-antitoxin system Phd/YefM family antitoxin [Rhodothermus marinus]|uniref:type II toxin-antitoxin system Phd/YefM family antitoxin n=1 Tax=Rhodothermus marinus TaxID=29549 RepID=UPI0012BA4760|nr:hypothetical protein RmaAA338_26040 [Rhodothermus marinus]
MRIGLQKARTQLSRLVERALRGEEVILTRRGKAVARLVPIQHDEPEMRPVALHRRKLTAEEVTASLEGVDPETVPWHLLKPMSSQLTTGAPEWSGALRGARS